MAKWHRRHQTFVENVEDAKVFYREVFGLPLRFEDEASAVFAYAIISGLDRRRPAPDR